MLAVPLPRRYLTRSCWADSCGGRVLPGKPLARRGHAYAGVVRLLVGVTLVHVLLAAAPG